MAYTGGATGNTGMASLMAIYYDKLALETLMPELVLYNLAEKKALPENEGKTVYFHRYYAGSNMVSAYKLTEGGSGAWPTWGTMSATVVSATVEQYGDAKQTSDFLELTAVSDVVEEAISQMMKEAADIIDRRTFQACYNTSSIPSQAAAGFLTTWPSAQGYAIATLSTLTSACIIDVNGIKAAVKDLKVLNAKPLKGGYFAAVFHPVQTYKLMSDAAWQNAYQYTDAENMRRGQVGRIYNVEVSETTNVYMNASGTGTANTTSAYYGLIFGSGALGVTELGGGLKTIIKRPNEYDTANPLNQWSSIGWKINFVPVVLNPSAGRILITADQ